MAATPISGLTARLINIGTELFEVALAGSANHKMEGRNVRRQKVTALTSAAGVVTVDLSLGRFFTLEPTENISGWTFTNPAGAGYGDEIVIQFTQAATPRTVSFTGFKQEGGATDVVSTTTGVIDKMTITTLDNWTTKLLKLEKAFA